MRYCKKCVQPDTRPSIYFRDGICGACLYEESKKAIDWDNREKELKDIVTWAKETTKESYDCIIGVSGGKDSTFQALTAKRLGLRVLLVNGEPENITEAGRDNIDNLSNLGFDRIKIRPNPKTIKNLIKRDFCKHLNPVKVTEFPLWASSCIIAEKFKIPLIIQGENPTLTLGVKDIEANDNALNANKLNTVKEGLGQYGVEEKDLFLYRYDQTQMKGIRAIWLQYYLKEWSQSHNAEVAIKNGFKVRPNFIPEDFGTYVNYFSVDTDLYQVNQMLKYLKFGFGSCTDHACYDIRDGKITRNEGIELVKKYDGKCGERFIKKFCDYIDIDIKKFWSVVDRFVNRELFEKENGHWTPKFKVGIDFDEHQELAKLGVK